MHSINQSIDRTTNWYQFLSCRTSRTRGNRSVHPAANESDSSNCAAWTRTINECGGSTQRSAFGSPLACCRKPGDDLSVHGFQCLSSFWLISCSSVIVYPVPTLHRDRNLVGYVLGVSGAWATARRKCDGPLRRPMPKQNSKNFQNKIPHSNFQLEFFIYFFSRFFHSIFYFFTNFSNFPI